jgi:hypothetical protein
VIGVITNTAIPTVSLCVSPSILYRDRSDKLINFDQFLDE